MAAELDHELETRIGKLEVTVSHVATAVDRLTVIMEKRSHTNWGVIASWVAVVMSLVIALYWPINEKLTRHTQAIDNINEQLIEIRSTRWSEEDHYKYEVRNAEELRRIIENVSRLERQLYEAQLRAIDNHAP